MEQQPSGEEMFPSEEASLEQQPLRVDVVVDEADQHPHAMMLPSEEDAEDSRLTEDSTPDIFPVREAKKIAPRQKNQEIFPVRRGSSDDPRRTGKILRRETTAVQKPVAAPPAKQKQLPHAMKLPDGGRIGGRAGPPEEDSADSRLTADSRT